jgi:hypothetical protein
MSGKLTVNGVQGHIAYPQLARNPIHEALPALAELAATVWDRGNAFFPPTSWQISNIHGGTGASNVIPGHVVIDFNFRFCTESSSDSLQKRVHEVLDRMASNTLVWTVGGQPFLTTPGTLVQAVQAAIKDEPDSIPSCPPRRHQRWPLHRPDLPSGHRDGPAQRQHPQDRRTHRRGRYRAAEKHLPQDSGTTPAPADRTPDRMSTPAPLISGNTVAELIASGARLHSCRLWPRHGHGRRRSGLAGALEAGPAPGQRTHSRRSGIVEISLYLLIYKRR